MYTFVVGQMVLLVLPALCYTVPDQIGVLVDKDVVPSNTDSAQDLWYCRMVWAESSQDSGLDCLLVQLGQTSRDQLDPNLTILAALHPQEVWAQAHKVWAV